MEQSIKPKGSSSSPSTGEWLALGMAMGFALVLGLSQLATPSLWHDELIHTYVGKSIAETGVAQLPSGVQYNNGTTQNYILAFMIKVVGLSEFTLRLPSVLFAVVNVLLIFFLTRPLLGSRTAAVAAIGLALSPWAVAWSREARFYTLQQTLYLSMLIAFWQGMERNERKAWIMFGLSAVGAYALAILTSFHSIIFLGSIGGYAILWMLYTRRWKTRWGMATLLITIVGLITIAAIAGLMNPLDKEAVMDRGGLGGGIEDPNRALRYYYLHWLKLNLSKGFYFLALFGFAAMLTKEKRKGLFTALAFWVPIIILTFFIGYRRPRFMFFVYPLYVIAWSYGLVCIVSWIARRNKQRVEWAVAVLLILFIVRLGLSFITLTSNSLVYAQGDSITLARKHPQWREPCLWLKEHQEANTVVITTTFLPVYHYLGAVDNWYPTRHLWWEVDESGMDDLKGLPELQAYMQAHPRGYFVTEYWRWQRLEGPEWQSDQRDEILWVKEHMTRLDEASNEDIIVWTWGLE